MVQILAHPMNQKPTNEQEQGDSGEGGKKPWEEPISGRAAICLDCRGVLGRRREKETNQK